MSNITLSNKAQNSANSGHKLFTYGEEALLYFIIKFLIDFFLSHNMFLISPTINHWIFFGTDSGWKNTFLLLKIGAIMYACFLTVTLIIFLLVFKLNNILCHVNISSSRSVSAIIKWMFCGCERQLGLGGASKLSLLKM